MLCLCSAMTSVMFEQTLRRQLRKRSSVYGNKGKFPLIRKKPGENNNKGDFVRSNEDKRCFNKDGDTAMKGGKIRRKKKVSNLQISRER